MEKRSIEDIRVKRKNKVFITKLHDRAEVDPIPKNIEIITTRKKAKSSYRGLFVIILLLILILFGIYKFLNIFYKADIIINSKHQIFELNSKKLLASKSLDSKVPFEIAIVSDNSFKKVFLSYSENVSLKAKGELTFYNEFSSSPQKLNYNTYISDDRGRTYVIDKTITIPGYKKVDGKIIPGKVDAPVTAFLTGDSYNGNPETFNIISFKNTSKYSKIYAKTKTPLSGGAEGLVYKLNQENIDSIVKDHIPLFKESLFKKIEVPPGYILYKDAVIFSYTIDEGLMSPIKEAEAKVSGTMTAVLIKEKDLFNYLLEDLIPKISKEERARISTKDVSLLKFNFIDKEQLVNKNTISVDFSLDGKIDFVWEPDLIVLINNLANLHKDSVSQAFEKDTGIDSASVEIFPPWKKYIPNNRSKINIVIN